MFTAVMTIALAASADPFAPVAFLAGSWEGTANGVTMEEHWIAPKGGLMLGTHRDVRDGKAISFEFLRIELREGVLTYVAMPNGGEAVPFRFASGAKDRAVFENKAHDFPQRIIYWRANDQLCARVEAEVKGKLEGQQWCWARQ